MVSGLSSKKFVAFLITQIGFLGLMGYLLYSENMSSIGANSAFMALVVTAGFLATGYILGQAALDKYLRVAEMATNKDSEDK